MERGRHRSLWLTRRVLPGRNFAAGLIEPGFHFICQFKLVLEVVVNPCADLLDFPKRQLWNCRLDFFDCAHEQKVADGSGVEESDCDPSTSPHGLDHMLIFSRSC